MYDIETYERLDDTGGLLEAYRVGHHNIIVHAQSEWLYFWRGECGVTSNKADAELQLMFLSGYLIDELTGLDAYLDELQELR